MTKEAEMIEGQMVTVTHNRPDFYYICVLSGPSSAPADTGSSRRPRGS